MTAKTPSGSSPGDPGPSTPIWRGILSEWPLLASVTTGALFVAFGGGWLADLSNPLWYAFIMAWLFGVILAAAFSVVHHAEALAERLGEPLGTLILTLAVTGIEVMMISAVMYAGPGNAAMARDAMFAVIMIVMNGMVGLALLLGGLRFREQTYNLAGANAFLAVIVPLGVLGLVIPNFTHSSPGPTLSSLHSIFLIVMALSLYAVFLAIQNVVHRDYFLDPAEGAARTPATAGHAGEAAHPAPSLVYHGLLLVVNILPLVLLSKKLAIPIEHGIDTLHAPAAMGGFLVAILILSPESLGAIRAALRNQLQRAVNILLGSVLATISLTIPSVLVIGFLTNREIVLGLDEVGMILLVLTLAVSAITFNSQKTNVLLGAVHLILFVAYLMLMFDR